MNSTEKIKTLIRQLIKEETSKKWNRENISNVLDLIGQSIIKFATNISGTSKGIYKNVNFDVEFNTLYLDFIDIDEDEIEDIQHNFNNKFGDEFLFSTRIDKMPSIIMVQVKLQEIKESSNTQGMSFKDAISKCSDNQKIIFGTRTNKFHLIDKSDRDFNTNYASTKEQAMKLGEDGVKEKSINPTFVK